MKKPITITVKELNLKELKKYFEKGLLAIPELQRNYVWNAQRLRDLADSIYKGYSIGTYTIWDAPKTKETFLRHQKGLLPPYESKRNDAVHYIIDGQQRLASLYSFLKLEGLHIVNDRGQEFDSKHICFTLKENEEDLNFIYSKWGADNIMTFSLCDILSNDFENRFDYLKKRWKNRYLKLKLCRSLFEKYTYVFVHLTGDINKDNLKETFIRLNTRGLSLSAVDRAYAYASDVRLREFVGRIKDKLGILKDMGDAPIHEVIYMINASKRNFSRFSSKGVDTIFKKINNDPLERSKFEKEWKYLAKAVSRAESFFKSQGVISVNYLPSKVMVPVLTIFYYYYNKDNLNDFIESQLIKWFWASAVSGRYTGKGYHTAVKDVQWIRRLAQGKKELYKVERKEDQTIFDDALYYSNRSSLVRAFYCLLVQQKPLEFFYGGKRIDLSNPTYREKSNFHHIFPENLMWKLTSSKKINSIINICFLPVHTNASFSDDPPFVYLDSEDIDHKRLNKILRSHVVPREIQNKHKNIKLQFEQFLEMRKKMIANAFEKAAGCQIFND